MPDNSILKPIILAILIYFTSTNSRHNGILVISTTEHQEPDLQTKIAIYLGLPVRLGLKIATVSKDLQLIRRTICGLHNPQRQLDTGFKQTNHYFRVIIRHVRFV